MSANRKKKKSRANHQQQKTEECMEQQWQSHTSSVTFTYCSDQLPQPPHWFHQLIAVGGDQCHTCTHALSFCQKTLWVTERLSHDAASGQPNMKKEVNQEKEKQKGKKNQKRFKQRNRRRREKQQGGSWWKKEAIDIIILKIPKTEMPNTNLYFVQ